MYLRPTLEKQDTVKKTAVCPNASAVLRSLFPLIAPLHQDPYLYVPRP
jgi:hypothetical protein